MNDTNSFPIAESVLLRTLAALEHQITLLSDQVSDLHSVVTEIASTKDWYTTAEVAAMMGVSQHTVQERYCNADRIECEKDPTTRKWRIPGHEFERLRKGGRPAGF